MKKIILFLCLILSSFFITGCSKEEPVIAFSKTPFSKEEGYNLSNTFKAGEKIYFAVYNPDEFKTRLLKLQVFKKDAEKSEFWGYEHLYNKTLELNNKKTFSDFVIINNKGHYVFQIFDFTDFHKPIFIGVIKVEQD